MSRSVPTSGLIQRKIHAITARIAVLLPVEVPFRELAGEGVYPRMVTADFLLSAPLLGAKKRRAADPEATCRLKELNRGARG